MKFLSSTFLLMCLCVLPLLTACASHSSQTEDPLGAVKLSFAVNNHALAAQQLLPLANEGNSNAQYALGYLFYYGFGVQQDTMLAREWFRRAAMQHNIKAVQALALISQHEAVFAPLPNEQPEYLTINP